MLDYHRQDAKLITDEIIRTQVDTMLFAVRDLVCHLPFAAGATCTIVHHAYISLCTVTKRLDVRFKFAWVAGPGHNGDVAVVDHVPVGP